METESKKISFGFSKQLKKLNLINTADHHEEKRVDFIECLEKQTIKVVGGEEVKKAALVIPLQQNKNRLHEKLPKNDIPTNLERILNNDTTNNPTLDELAAQELLNDIRNSTKDEKHILTVPNKDQISIEGENESTLEDYDNIPISEFGLAMLRGMGWKETPSTGKDKKVEDIVVRPKGMGLGADKTSYKPKVVNNDGEDLKIVKNAYIKITSGRHQDTYGQVHGFDDDSGTVIIKTAIGGRILSLNEFLITPVTKSDYIDNSKVLNAKKYADYKTAEKSGKEYNTDEKKTSRNELKENSKKSSNRHGEGRSSSTSHKTDDRYRSKHYESSREKSDSRSKRDDKRDSSRDKRRDKKHKRKNHSRSRSRSRS